MRKFQFFLLVEALLLTMALLRILSQDVTSFVFILVVTLLALRFYNIGHRNNFLLTGSLLLLFLIVMLNPYVITAILCGVAYTMINHFAQVKQKNRHALLKFQEADMPVRTRRNQWLGSKDSYQSDHYAFDDINVLRLSGSDVIDLSQVIVTGYDNVVIIRKIYGPTRILVPMDVSVILNVSALYSSVRFFETSEYDLRNESIKLQHQGVAEANRSVKIMITTIAGDVEVTEA